MIFSGGDLAELVLENPLVSKLEVPVVIYNEVKSSYGSGMNAVSPGHDISSLRIATVR